MVFPFGRVTGLLHVIFDSLDFPVLVHQSLNTKF